jgi:hypothetical protein
MKIGFSMQHGNIISESIVFFTKDVAKVKPYISHTFPILGILNKMELAFSADEFFINIVDVERYRGREDYSLRIYQIPDIISPDIWQKKIIKKYNQKIYPHLELLWFVYRYLRRKIKKDWNGKNWFDYSSFCSELTIKALELAGYNFNVDSNATDAIELENLILSIPGSILIEQWNKGIRKL